jgi:ATP-dependent RNA helicase DeaD
VVWFRVLLGRERNADPRWILPLVCRRGGVGREQIGKIEVLPRETRFEVARAAAGAFAEAALRPDPRMPEARIEPLPAPHRPAAARAHASAGQGHRAPGAHRTAGRGPGEHPRAHPHPRARPKR